MKKISVILISSIMISFLGLFVTKQESGLKKVFAMEEGERGLVRVPGEEGSILKSVISQFYQKSWALVIGIDNYSHPKIPDLRYAVNDAKSVAIALEHLGFPGEQIFLLLNEQATHQAIEQVLYNRLRDTGKSDRLFVFFAGHGTTESLPRGDSEGFLPPYDADLNNLFTTAISMSDVKRMRQRIAAKHILFAVDACYSGFSITRAIAPRVVDENYLNLVTQDPAVQVITAGKAGEQVREENGHGIFTNQLLKALQGFADEDQDSLITGIELASFIQSRVIRETDGGQHPQFGQLFGEGQFIFILPKNSFPADTVQLEPEGEEPTGESRYQEEMLKQEQVLKQMEEILRKQKELEEALKRKEEVQKQEETLKQQQISDQGTVPPADLKGKLEIVSIPLEAQILLNDRYLGRTPITLEVEVGEYTIWLKKPGYLDYQKKVKITPGQTERISGALRSLNRRH